MQTHLEEIDAGETERALCVRVAVRARVLRDLLYLAAEHGRSLVPELVSAHELAAQLAADVEAMGEAQTREAREGEAQRQPAAVPYVGTLA